MLRDNGKEGGKGCAEDETYGQESTLGSIITWLGLGSSTTARQPKTE